MKPETSSTFERKRTANLESLIGNLKVRKMSESTPKQQKMHSLYVEVSGSSDCSRSTPPLSSSSPSVSPSSISPDSPVQSNVSSSLSSISSSSLATASNSSKSRSLLPKFRWMMESSPQENSFKEDQEFLDVKQETQFYNSIQTKKIKTPKKTELKVPSKQNDDPSRAVKFYDDYVDFRGDILRRPPNSKNCRILWEYLFLLLQDPTYSSVIKWEDDVKMIFRIVQAEKLAALWGLQKNRLGMTYEKLSRGMRYYYPNNIIAREPGRRLLYRFMRHPDEIKKFVKKNGTYMLKKAKPTKKEDNKNEVNHDDSGVDEPGRCKNEEIEDEFIDEEIDHEAGEVDTQCDESDDREKTPSPEPKNDSKQNTLNALGQNPVQFYSDLYQYMYQAQMAAAAQMGLPSAYGMMRGEQNEPMMKQLMTLLAQQQNFNNLKIKNGASDSSSYSSSSSTHSLESESNEQLTHPLNLSTMKKKKSKHD